MIQRRGRTWWLDVWVGHGKTRRRVRRSLKTDERALALERARDLSAELEREDAGRGGVTFEQFVPKYLTWSRDTKASYRSERYQVPVIRAWFEEHGARRLEDVTPYLIEQFRMDVSAHHRLATVTPRASTKANANRYCALLRVMFNRARDWGLFAGPNPVSRVRFYPNAKETTIISDEEKAAIMAAAVRIRAAADERSPIQRVLPDFLELLFSTGLRRSEALELKWRDIRDTTANVLGKGGKWRRVPLNAAARAVIERQPQVSIYVFDIPNRRQPQLFNHTIRRLRTLSGVGHFHLHLCRHWFTAALLRVGVDIKTIGDILGHSRISISLIYASSSPAGRQQAVDALDAKLGHGTVSGGPSESPQEEPSQ